MCTHVYICAYREKLEGEKDFEVVGDLSELQPQQEKQKTNGQQELADKALAGKSYFTQDAIFV